MAEERFFPVEIGTSSHWVGNRPEGSIFFANPYLRIFRGKDAQGQNVQYNLLIDPGSSIDFAGVQAKVTQLIGGMQAISAIFINHQDPDVGSASTLLLGRFAPHALILCSEDTWRLIRHFNLPKERYVSLDKYPQGFRLPTGHRLLPVPSPFCHFSGAVMLYDPETRILYTGDLFGGLTDQAAKGIWADQTDWIGMRAFHQIYMPTNKALRYTIQAIRRLVPQPLVLAPQHGRVIREAEIPFFLRHLEELSVGLDLLQSESLEELQAWTRVLQRVVWIAEESLGELVQVRLQDADHEIKNKIIWEGELPIIVCDGRWVVEQAIVLLTENTPSFISAPIKYEAIVAAEEMQLSTPNVQIEEGDPPSA